MENIETPEIEILNFLNQVVAAPRGFRPIKSNLNGISNLFKHGFTKEEIIERFDNNKVPNQKNPHFYIQHQHLNMHQLEYLFRLAFLHTRVLFYNIQAIVMCHLVFF